METQWYIASPLTVTYQVPGFFRDSDSDLSDEESEAHIPGEKQTQHDLLLAAGQEVSNMTLSYTDTRSVTGAKHMLV